MSAPPPRGLLRWYLRGAPPVPLLLSNLHSLALQGAARRHPLAASGLGLGALVALALWPGASGLALLPALWLLAQGLWLELAGPLSRALGLRALQLLPAPRPWVEQLLRGRGVALVGPVLELHLDTRADFRSPDGVARFEAALARDARTLRALSEAGAFGRATLLANTFNKRVLAALAAELGGQRLDGCALLEESARMYGRARMERIQRRMFGALQPGVGPRDRVEGWSLLVMELGVGWDTPARTESDSLGADG